ncbi:MAG: nonribosomal peptide synthetase [Anaerobacillus sp.]|uniref:SF0329 family protein n=1 Tax=Anaerobacillus sp. TaxID=1872506 RepID=UPI00391D844F
MQWSKTKSTLESFLCDKLKGRIKLYATVYRKFPDCPARVWITFDKKEIVSASDLTYAVKHEKLYQLMKEEGSLSGIPYNPDWDVMFNSLERQELIKASEDTEEMMKNQSIFEGYHFYAPLIKYSSLSIDEAMNSENIIIKAYSMLDRRLGKRRLKQLIFTKDTHPLVVHFYKIRCEVEGLGIVEDANKTEKD